MSGQLDNLVGNHTGEIENIYPNFPQDIYIDNSFSKIFPTLKTPHIAWLWQAMDTNVDGERILDLNKESKDWENRSL